MAARSGWCSWCPLGVRRPARRAIFAWINTYNHRRLHSRLGYEPPVEWEAHDRQPPARQAA